ncbi:MAG: DUF4388 domain-containing protein [Ktedonobacteraceae bacterium]|nr:DUF4388 domain-containing protein [Ktedonobacteraceae bacterium]
MKLRGGATDKLADVVQVLQLAHKTGLLQVQRNTVDNFVEQGTITFLDGQVVEASVGQFHGQDAFKKLMTWATCHFVFEPAPSTPPSPSLSGILGSAASTQDLGFSREPSDPYAAVPYRLWQVNGVLPNFHRLGLSRIHRQLFLLVDGKRSVYELTSLIRHRPQEVLGILTDLERTGLIGR